MQHSFRVAWAISGFHQRLMVSHAAYMTQVVNDQHQYDDAYVEGAFKAPENKKARLFSETGLGGLRATWSGYMPPPPGTSDVSKRFSIETGLEMTLCWSIQEPIDQPNELCPG